MRIISFALMFLCFVLPQYFNAVASDRALAHTEKERIIYNNALDGAVEDAVSGLAEYDSGDEIYLNKDAAVECFFQSLYSGFGILEDEERQEWMKLYVPIVLVTDEDGYYIYHNYQVTGDDGKHIYQEWSEKCAYSFVYQKYVCAFTLTNQLRVLDTESGSCYEGNFHDLKGQLPEIPFLASDASYQTVRQMAVADCISESMEYYMNQHNRIARDYGISYQFFLPDIPDEDWARTISDVSVMVLFQGYPYESIDGFYNRVETSAARILKKKYYYITRSDGILYYHESSCSKVTDRSVPYESTKECAALGAYPCQDCTP